ncbi:MAG: amidase family protein [Patescibacteria group bacterium]
MSSLNTLTLKQTIDGLSEKQFSAADVFNDVSNAIEKDNSQLNIYLTLNKEASSESEKAVSPSKKFQLAGVPLAVKDNFLTEGLRTTASSTVLDNFIPPYESTVTAKIKDAGGIIVGKTNMDAWAHGSSTETSQYGRTLNPRNPEHLPGGSSGGSAAAVASNMCIAAIGSETAGSIRQPAAWCGVVGLKPTYGRVSRYGVVAMGSSLDCPGPMTKTVEDSAILLNILAGKDFYDATSSSQKFPDYTLSLNKGIKGLKVGVLYLNEPGLQSVKPMFEKELKVLEDLGAHVEHAQAMDPTYAIAMYTVIQRSEVSSNLARYDGIRFGNDRSFFGDEAKRRIMLGTYTLSKGYADKYYLLAQKVRTLFRQDYDRLFEKYDVLVSLPSPGFAKKVGATNGAVMFGEMEDMLVEPSSMTGLPGISVPCYRDEKTKLFLGMNIMAPFFREDLVIQVADAYEKATKWNEWRNN